MNRKTQLKTLHYARAGIFPATQPQNLQQLLDDAYAKLGTALLRTHKFGDGGELQTRYYRKRGRAAGSQFHIVSYVQDEPTSIVPRASPREVDADLDSLDPPAASDYMDGEAILVVRENNVIVCRGGIGVADSRIAEFFEQIVIKSDVADEPLSIDLTRVSDANQISLIAKYGVKALVLNSAMDAAELSLTKRKASTRGTIIGAVRDRLRALAYKDDPPAEEAIERHLSTEVVIKVDRMGRGELSEEKLTSLAQTALEQGKGVKIVLTNGYVLTDERTTTRKEVPIAHEAKRMFRSDAFEKLDTWKAELKIDGYFD